ncbi:MAG: O-antigen ligase family protein [Deltaproteobacteria bacterium]|jgi:O-antigen ligase|nr:O-antigen ligase family protein [Deltaproteobacteria bacterium]
METTFPRQAPPFQFRLAGPAILCLLAFTGVFARGLANGAYAFLLAWAIANLVMRRRAGLPGLSQIPVHYWAGAGAFMAAYALAAAFSGEPLLSLRRLGLLVYLLSALPAVWLAAAELPQLLESHLPLCYGAGLMAAGVWACLEIGLYGGEYGRAKAALGVIELAAVLGQLIPLMVAALALSRASARKTVFYLAAIALGLVAVALNNSRIAMICVPVLSLMTLLAFRRQMGFRLTLALVLLAALAAGAAVIDGRAAERFAAMTDLSGANVPNTERLARWRQGLSVFAEHPVLGAGPGAVPNVPAEDLPEVFRILPRTEYYHSHQIFITALAEAGIVGLAGFLALHLLPLLYVLPALRSERPWTRFWAWGALTVFLQLGLNGLVDNVFTLKPLMYVYWTATGMAVFLAGRERRGPSFKGRASPLRAASPRG